MSKPSSTLSPKWFFQVVDAAGLLTAFAVAHFSLPYWGPWLNPNFDFLYENSSSGLLVLTLPLWILLLDGAGTYADPVRVSYRYILWGMLKVLFIGLGVLTLVVFAIKEQGVSRLFVFSFACLSFATLTGIRFVEKVYYGSRHRAGYYSRYPLVIGVPGSIQILDELIQASEFGPNFRINALPVGLSELTKPDDWIADFTSKLRQRLAQQSIHEVILILNTDTAELVNSVASVCAEIGQPLRLISESLLQYRLSSNSRVYADFFFGLPSLLLLQAEQRPAYEFAKRLFDLLFSAILLVLLSPLLFIIALVVKLSSPGPVFYRWKVLGKNNREFTGYKFRTMVANADQLKANLLQYNEMTGPVFKMKHDPRITPVGRFLRRYSLDELPQLFSVLKGDMSLVGPRPPLQSEFKRFEFWQARKLSIKPGITCLWQINGRNEINDFDEWVRLDLEYIDQRSFLTDFQILSRTVVAVLRGTGH